MNYVGNEPAPGGLVLVGDTNPVGMVIWSHGVPDASYLQMNGQVVSKTTYSLLWAYAQSYLTADQTLNPGLYRSVDASTFAVPKLDGLFIRGTGQVDGSHVAAALGVKQSDDNLSHSHLQQGANFTGAGGLFPLSGTPNAPGPSGTSTTLSGGVEARPVNVALVPCVKALRTLLIPVGTISPAYTFATQAEMEAAVEAAKVVSPATAKFSPSAAKAWVRFTMANPPVILASYNIASVIRGGVGTYTVNFSVPFSSANYCVSMNGDNVGGTGNFLVVPNNQVAGSVGACSTGASFGALADGGTCHVACFGDQ